MTTYPQGKDTPYTIQLEQVAIKMDSGIDFLTALEQTENEGKDPELFD